MRSLIRSVFEKYRQEILYLFFGGLTTLVNYLVYAACFLLLAFERTIVPNCVAWVAAVVFAYLTNRVWVFHSTAHGAAQRLRELLSFGAARVVTLLLETALLWLLVDVLQFPNLVIKLSASILVVILNYLFSKFWTFRDSNVQ